MKLAYGSSIAGVSHIKRKRPCQDAFFIANSDFALIAAVCDGVGSQKHSGMASAVASEACVKHCIANMKPGMDDNSILAVICHAFEAALDAVENEARAQNLDIWQCDTTMTLGVLANGDLYYGQSGDSGMIALFSDGSYLPVTKQQNDSDGRVYPLRMNSSWAYDKVEGKVASALLCTDGIWKLVNAGDPEQAFFRLNYYMDPRAIFLRSTQGSRSESLGKWTESELYRINAEEASGANYDDLTMVIMHDTNICVTLGKPIVLALDAPAPDVPEIILPDAPDLDSHEALPNLAPQDPDPLDPDPLVSEPNSLQVAADLAPVPNRPLPKPGLPPEPGNEFQPDIYAPPEAALAGPSQIPLSLERTVNPGKPPGMPELDLSSDKTVDPKKMAGKPSRFKFSFKLPKIIKRTDA
ncbi:MAG: protein phosphatase 2C domain-containing protein [Clostridiales bacterium]|jgi:serine/threonine protein phosphatase PrpC|nr:protein phosphatase 2C domain-containing protein [Clostridiales bacterium]MDR2752097.1 protein phosphatase 2C domain-containing protein [Clostridiales bacterium]